MKHKHHAIIITAVLVVVFLGLLIWYMATHPAPTAYAPIVATTTPQTHEAYTGRIAQTGTYYDIEADYPTTVPVPNGEAAVARMKTYFESYIEQFKDTSGLENLTEEDARIQGLGERKYALSIEYETYTGERTVSYVYTIYEDTLGAHPNGYYQTFTFDMQTGKVLELRDLFSPSVPYLERLSARTRADLPEIIRDMGGDFGDPEYIRDGTEPTFDNFRDFYIDGRNLIIIFSPYQVGPYALGTVLDTIPLSGLAEILDPIYLP